jgi:hypothetical protein
MNLPCSCPCVYADRPGTQAAAAEKLQGSDLDVLGSIMGTEQMIHILMVEKGIWVVVQMARPRRPFGRARDSVAKAIIAGKEETVKGRALWLTSQVLVIWRMSPATEDAGLVGSCFGKRRLDLGTSSPPPWCRQRFCRVNGSSREHPFYQPWDTTRLRSPHALNFPSTVRQNIATAPVEN